MKELKEYIRSIPDFPEKGIIFRDVTSVLQDADALKLSIDELAKRLEGVDFDVIAGAESRGFIFGAPLAYVMHKPFVPIRKKGKLPCETVEKTYDLEYGTATIEMHKDAVKKGEKVVLLDDLIATGGTMKAAAELAGSEISAVNVLTKMLRLSQMTGGYLTDDAGSITSVSTAKLDALSDILDTMLAEEKKLVILARFAPELDGIQELLKRKQIGYASVRGGVSDRAEEIRRFQEDAACKVFVGQIAAAGLGITLTAASTMVFYSLDYSMSNFEQAKARIHRVSQTENCLYIYLTAKHTVDTKILRALRDKADLAKMLVDDYRNGSNPFQEGVWNANTEYV